MLRFTDNVIAQMTLGCNCNCKYCYEGRTHNNKQFIDHELFKKLLDKYIYDRCILGNIENYCNWHFHGGEVLTLPWEELKKDIEYLNQRKKYFPNLTMSIQTNGTLLTEEMAKYFADNNVALGISWDGYVSDRMPESANRFLIDKLRDYHSKYGTKYQVLLVLSQNNLFTWLEDIKSISDFISGFGINPVCTLSKDDNLLLTPDEQWEYWFKPVLESMRTSSPLHERYVDIIMEKLIAENVLITDDLSSRKTGCFDRVCGFGSNMTAITPDLRVHNCDKFMEEGDYISKRVDYSLSDPDFLGLQQSKRCVSHYRQLIDKEKELKCSSCPMSWACTGECQSYNISKTGEVQLHNDICELYLKVYKYFEDHWPELLEHLAYSLLGDVRGITPFAKNKLNEMGYEIKIDTQCPNGRVWTVKKGEDK